MDKCLQPITDVEEEDPSPTWLLVRVAPNGWVQPAKYRDLATHIYNFPLDPGQAWVVGFPRSGTTMMQELVWLIHNNVDFEAAKEPIQKRVNFVDSNFIREGPVPEDIQLADKRNVIKTHLSFDVLPPRLLETCKAIK